MRVHLGSVILLFSLWHIGSGLTVAEAETSPNSITVAASIPPLACLVQQLGGPSLRVDSIIPLGANHETFEPGLAQIRSVLNARFILSTGHPYFSAEEAWIKKVHSLDRRIETVTLFNSVCGSLENCPDPHFWVSTRLFVENLKFIAGSLRGVDLSPKIIDNGFAITTVKFNESLNAARELLEPYKGRKFLTYHAAWPYFAEEFGLTELSLEKGGKELGLAGLSTLTEEVRAAKINTLFVESVESSTGARHFAESNKLKLVELNPTGLDCVDFPRLVAQKLVNSFR